MSLYDIHQPSWPHFNDNNTYPCFIDDHIGDYDYSPLFSANENSIDISSSMKYLENIFSDHEYIMELPILVDGELHPPTSPIDDFLMDLDDFDLIFDDRRNETSNSPDVTQDISGDSYNCRQSSPDDGDGFHELDPDHASNPCDMATEIITSLQPSLLLPFEGMEMDNQFCLIHLFMAYAEAVENQEIELSEVIAQSIIQKVNPSGGSVERVLYYVFQHLIKQSDYLIQESMANFYPAFKALYQALPHGRFAHLAANSAILEALPKYAEIVLHIIDFDTGEGIQLASLMESIKYHQNIKEIRIKFIHLTDEDEIAMSPLRWRFEETKRRLCDHARSCGLKIKVEEVELQDLEIELNNKTTTKGDCYNGVRKSWYAFNCNVGLPHMGRVRSRKDVYKFLKVAKNFLKKVKCSNSGDEGIISYCDGDAPFIINDPSTSCSSFSSFLNGNFIHYRSLLESLEFSFPKHLGEARTVLECLFVAPYVSSLALIRKWEDKMQYDADHLQFGHDLEGFKFSEAILIEAKEVLKGRDSLHGVRIGEQNSEIVMQWNGIPMVRVCCWKG